jgi:glycosyltransferase involved in cell wall biosynthesis
MDNKGSRMHEPLLSVIMPAFNCQDYICEAVDTVLEQSYKNVEIIVVDSSTDQTRELLKQYHEKVVYFFQEPKGVAAARNFGLSQARGSLVAFQDADDRWLPNKLKAQVQALQRFPAAKLVFSDYATFDHSGVILPSSCFPHFKLWLDRHKIQGTSFALGQLYWELMLGNCIGTCSVLAVKDTLDEYNGFDEAFKTCEDLDLWLRISTKYPVLYIDEVLAEYRVRSTGLSGSFETRNMTWSIDRAKVREKHLRSNLVPDNLRPRVRQLQGKHCWELGWASLSGGAHRKARTMFLMGLPYRPNDWRMWLYCILTFLPPSIVALGKRAKHAFREILPSAP